MGKFISSFECHITTTVADAGKAEEIAKLHGWKTSEIKRDPLLGPASHFYLTAHAEDYHELYCKMRSTCKALDAAACTILREKIEGIIYDTKTRTYGGDEHKHIDDLAVDAFNEDMKQRLAVKRSQGYGGWEDPSHCTLRDRLIAPIQYHANSITAQSFIKPGVDLKLLDISNYCMMAYHRVRNGPWATLPVTFCKKCDKPDYRCTCTPRLQSAGVSHAPDK